MSKVIWQEAASPCCHLRGGECINSSAACAGQAHSPAAGVMYSCVGTLQYADVMSFSKVPQLSHAAVYLFLI